LTPPAVSSYLTDSSQVTQWACACQHQQCWRSHTRPRCYTM